jgi:hypothetical protein
MDDELLDILILEGMVEVAGIDSKTGEMLYNFTKKILERPDLMAVITDTHVQEIYYLWEQGFLNMNMLEDNPTVRITPKALDDHEVDQLPTHLQIALRQIVEASRVDGDS